MDYSRLEFPHRKLPILLYHQVVETSPREACPTTAIPLGMFERQMKYLSEDGFNVISLEGLLGLSCQDMPMRKTVIITFDDGYLDNYINAFPILEKYGFSATIFLTTDFLGKMHAWPNCKEVPYMSWEYVREMSNYRISFQSHSCTHPDMTFLEDRFVMEELLHSREMIENRIGYSVKHFSYPFGFFDRRVKALVQKAEYECACAVSGAGRDKFEMERFMVTSKDHDLLFRLKTSGWGNWIRRMWHRIAKPDYESWRPKENQ
jgi:peptidoglycan/xylan/chitin deacetylase (PgdA/CDA1 family)